MKVNDLIILDKINTLYNFYIERAKEVQITCHNSLTSDAKEFVRRVAEYEFEKAKIKCFYENSTHIKIPAISFIDNNLIKTYRSLSYNDNIEVLHTLLRVIEADNIYVGKNVYNFLKLFPSVTVNDITKGILTLLEKEIRFTQSIPDNDLLFVNKRTAELVSATLLCKNTKFIDNE